MSSDQPYVGIDVAKNHLEWTATDQDVIHSLAYEDDDVDALVETLKSIDPQRIILEATGKLETPLVRALIFAELPVVVVNPRQVREFARSTGRLAKTDALDASVLAAFGEAVQPELRELPNEQQRRLKGFVTRRRQLIQMRTAEQNRKERMHDPDLRDQIDAHVEMLNHQIDECETAAQELIEKSPVWQAQQRLLCSVPGVGKITSRVLLACCPELGQLNRREIAKLVGVAPLNCDSGQMRGRRTTWGGRAPVRSVLYLAATAATQWNPHISQFYERLRERGKKKMVALVACMRKLLTILNAILRDGRAWDPSICQNQ